MFAFAPENQPLKLEEKYLCLDFANTLDWRRSEKPRETLNSYGDLIRWAETVGLISAEKAQDLWKRAEQDPDQAQEVLRQSIELREIIYRVFSAEVQEKQSASAKDIEALNAFLSNAMARARLVESAKGFSWIWAEDSTALNSLLWPVARSAGELLTSNDFIRVGECASEQGCGWLFYDATRNHSRRWCSMESCGNRAKAHRHYQRQKPPR